MYVGLVRYNFETIIPIVYEFSSLSSGGGLYYLRSLIFATNEKKWAKLP